MHYSGVEYDLNLGTAGSNNLRPVHNMHLCVYEEDDIWKQKDSNTYKEVILEEVEPLLEDFRRVVDEVFDEFSTSTTLRKQTFVELKV